MSAVQFLFLDMLSKFLINNFFLQEIKTKNLTSTPHAKDSTVPFLLGPES